MQLNNLSPPESCIKIYNGGIKIDGIFDDWVNINPVLTDMIGDVYNNDFVDFKNVYLASDNTYLYVRFEMNNSLEQWGQPNFDVAINFIGYGDHTFISALFNSGPSTGYSNVCIDGTFTMTYPSSFATYSGNNVEFKVLLSDLTFLVEGETSIIGYSENHTNGVNDNSNPIILCN